MPSLDELFYRAGGDGRSQCERILRALQSTPGQWWPMPQLARAASPNGEGTGLAVHSRIADLRKALKEQGYTIVKRLQRGGDGATHSFYRIEKLGAPDLSGTDTPVKTGAPQLSRAPAEGPAATPQTIEQVKERAGELFQLEAQR